MKKSTLIAVVVFAALLVAVVLTTGRKAEKGITRISFASLDTGSVDRISVTGKNPVDLKREAGTWVLGDGRAADSSAVDRLIEALPRIESSDLVTRDPSRFAELEVDDEKGSRVAAFAGGKEMAAFTVGKSGPGGAHVRIGDAVYLVKRVYPYIFSKAASGWYKLKLFDTKLDDVAKVEVRLQGSTPYSLVKKEDKWQLEDPGVVPAGFRFDADAARSLASSLVNLRAREIVVEDPGAEKTGLDGDTDRLAFDDGQGQRIELHLGKPDEKQNVFARVQGGKDTYLLSSYTAKSLRKAATDLRDLKLIDLDTDKVTALRIQDGKEQLVFEKQGADWKIRKSSEKIPDDFELDPALVKSRLTALARARATAPSPVQAAPATGLVKPRALLEAVLEDQSKVALVFGKATQEDNREVVYARGNIDPAIYLVAKGTRSSLTGMLKTFKKRPLPPGGGGMPNLDPQALSKLPPEVRSSLMQQMRQKQQQQKMMEAIQKKMEAQEKQKPSP